MIRFILIFTVWLSCLISLYVFGVIGCVALFMFDTVNNYLKPEDKPNKIIMPPYDDGGMRMEVIEK